MRIPAKISLTLGHGKINNIIILCIISIIILCTSCGKTITAFQRKEDNQKNSAKDITHEEKQSLIGWTVQNDGMYYNHEKKVEFDDIYQGEDPAFSYDYKSDLVYAYIKVSDDIPVVVVGYSFDNGKSWNKDEIKDDIHGVGSVYTAIPDENRFFVLYCSDAALGQMTKILYSYEDNKGFTKLKDLTDITCNYPIGMGFASEDDGIIILQNHGDQCYMLQTHDGGKTFNKVNDLAEGTHYSYIDARELERKDETWYLTLNAAGENGNTEIIFTSNDGFKTWVRKKKA